MYAVLIASEKDGCARADTARRRSVSARAWHGLRQRAAALRAAAVVAAAHESCGGGGERRPRRRPSVGQRRRLVEAWFRPRPRGRTSRPSGSRPAAVGVVGVAVGDGATGAACSLSHAQPAQRLSTRAAAAQAAERGGPSVQGAGAGAPGCCGGPSRVDARAPARPRGGRSEAGFVALWAAGAPRRLGLEPGRCALVDYAYYLYRTAAPRRSDCGTGTKGGSQGLARNDAVAEPDDHELPSAPARRAAPKAGPDRRLPLSNTMRPHDRRRRTGLRDAHVEVEMTTERAFH